MMTDSKPRILHVANGTATTRLIEAARIPGRLSIWADVLYEGPVPGGLTDAELLEVRRSFLGAGAEDVEPGIIHPSLDPVNDLREWRAVIERSDAYDELILWFEHDLFDQLNLIQLLTWIHGRLPGEKTVSLVMIGSFPGRAHFKGLGELSPAELASLLDQRQRVSERQYETAAHAWDAFRSPTPEALDLLRQRDTSALPYLAAAITRFLQEYPWTSDGLSRTERRLLSLARDGGISLSSAFPRMHIDEDAYYVTDGSLASTASDLAQTSPPLLILNEPAAASRHLLAGSVALTEAGEAVLAGAQDRIAMCGIDRWLGGVYLQTGGSMWRWDDTRKRITPS
jgi:hypothetical protein